MFCEAEATDPFSVQTVCAVVARASVWKVAGESVETGAWAAVQYIKLGTVSAVPLPVSE